MEQNLPEGTRANFLYRHCAKSVITVNILMTIGVVWIFYYFVPFLLNLSPIQKKLMNEYKMSYTNQFILLPFLYILVSSLVLVSCLKGMEQWEKLLKEDSQASREKLCALRKRMMNASANIFWIQAISALIIALADDVVFYWFYQASWIGVIKFTIIIFNVISLLSVLTYIFTKTLFVRILVRTYDNRDVQGRRMALKVKMVNLVFPLMIAIILLSFLFGYSRVIQQRGYFVFESYRRLLEEDFGRNIWDGRPEHAFAIMDEINVAGTRQGIFLVNPKGDIVHTGSVNMEFLRKYNIQKYFPKDGGRIFYSDAENNAAVIILAGPDGYWYAGVKYNLVSREIALSVTLGPLAIIIAAVLLTFLFMKAVAMDITEAQKYLSQAVLEPNNGLWHKIPITCNDEVSDLILAFNQIREKDFAYDQLKTDFFANISHELRTPLSVLLGTLQLFESNLRSPAPLNGEKAIKHIKAMRQNCHRLLRLVNNLIDSTRIDAGYLQPRLENRNLVPIVEGIVLSMAEYIKTLGKELIFHTETEEKTVALDVDFLERIVMNLLSNAVKFSGKDGSIRVSLLDRGDIVTISVKDNGIGIPMEKQKLIFERFGQADGLLTRNHEGSGIGLFLVRSFAELMGGSVSMLSEPGKGSEFLVDLPVKLRNEEEPPIQEDQSRGSSLDKVRIELSDIT